MRHAGWFVDGEIVSSARCHRLELLGGGANIPVVGIGGVLTDEAHRGRGHARAMLGAVLEEARRDGAGAALLFSDIAPSFYEPLGFSVVSPVLWQAQSDALPETGALDTSPQDDATALIDLYERSWGGDWVYLRREPARYADHRALALHREGETLGYVVAHRTEDALWISDLVTLDVAPAVVWATLRALADRHGCAELAGWLRPEHASGPFVATRRTLCVPMIARLDARLPDDARLHFSWLDRF